MKSRGEPEIQKNVNIQQKKKVNLEMRGGPEIRKKNQYKKKQVHLNIRGGLEIQKTLLIIWSRIAQHLESC